MNMANKNHAVEVIYNNIKEKTSLIYDENPVFNMAP